MTVLELENKPLPKWQRLCFWDEDTDEIYVLGMLAASEMSVLMCLGHDGVSCVTEKGHVYAPLSWLRKECKDLVDFWNRTEERIRTHLAKQ